MKNLKCFLQYFKKWAFSFIPLACCLYLIAEPKIVKNIADLWVAIIEPLSDVMKIIVTIVVGYGIMGIVSGTLIYLDEKEKSNERGQ